MKVLAFTFVTFAAATAYANPAERCAAGVAHAKQGDLPRASLYLEACDPATLDAELADQVSRASAEVAKKLRASELSGLTIITQHEGAVAEISALRGEQFTTPATIWTGGGSYELRIARDAEALARGTVVKQSVKIEPRSRQSV